MEAKPQFGAQRLKVIKLLKIIKIAVRPISSIGNWKNSSERFMISFYLLEERGPVVGLVDLPHFIQSPNLNTANDKNGNQTAHHDHRLKHICPYNGF